MNKLVTQAKKGDIQSFSTLINEIQVELYNIAKIKINDEDDVNDILQETIIDIYSGIKKLKDDRLFKTWSVRILLNNCNNLLKKKYKDKNIVSLEEYVQENKEENENNMLEGKEYNFDEIMKLLSKQEQITFALFYQEDYKISEIADVLQINPNTVKSILKRGREKIKNNFKELSGYEE